MSDTPPSMKSERKRGSGAKTVYDLLRNEILELTLAPGSPIDEIQLADRFQMSRTPIREALVRLAGEGLVETLPNRSTMVSNIDFLNLTTFFDALVLMYRVTTRLAAQHHQQRDLDIIRSHHQAYAKAVEARDALAMIATNAAFHAAIAEAGRNPYFTSLFRRILDDGRRILILYYRSFGEHFPSRFAEEHAELIRVIEQRDLEAADRLGKAHAEQIVKQVQKLFAPGDSLNIRL